MTGAVHAAAAPPVSWADYLRLPEDLVTYEIVDGLLFVNPSPTNPHQRTVVKLLMALNGSCPEGYVVLPAPADWVLSEVPLQVRQPDVLVVTEEVSRLPRTPAGSPPLLAVEVLSPGTARTDLTTKATEYGDAGLAHYLVADPGEPSLRHLARRGGRLVQVAHAVGAEALHLPAPFDVDLVPADLV